MGSLGDGDDKNNPDNRDLAADLSDTETQNFDSQFSPQPLSGGEFTDEDTLPLEDDFETQVVNLGGETQAVNIGDETQAVNLGDETQAVNLGDETQAVNLDGETQVLDYLDCVENNGIQLLSDDCDTEVVVDTDDEGSGRTEILCDTEEVSDDSSVKRVATLPVDQENMLHTAMQKNVGEIHQVETRALSNEEHSSGSVSRGFTSLRAASVRASGLAALNTAFKGTNSGSCSAMNENQSLKQHSAEHDATPLIKESSNFEEEIDQENTTGEYVEQMKGLSNKNKCRVGRSAVRKLFTEDTLAETKGLDDNMNNADAEAENGLVGLSYVDSQEPGESSQANALDFVDRFLKFTVVEFDQEVDLGKTVGGKSKHVSSAKGTQSLAKSANLLSSAVKRGIFDWDDSREDEGGGEFFRKKKEAFFGNENQRRKSSKQPQRPRSLDSKSGAAEDEKERKGNDESTKSTEAMFGKNLIKEFDEEFNTGSKDGMVETGSDMDMLDMMNIGLDTQMAAEAMEALCFGRGGGTEVNYDDANQGSKNMEKGSSKGETKNRARRSHTYIQKGVSSNSGVVTRQSKQTKKTKLSKESSKSSPRRSTKDRNQLKKANSKANSDVTEHLPANENENLSEIPSMTAEKRKRGKTPKINDIDKNIRCQVTIQMPVKKQRIQGQSVIITPVACRTRQCMGANQAKRCGEASSDLRAGMSMTGSGGPKDKRKRSRTSLDAFAEDKSTKVDEESDPKSSATPNAVKVDTLEYPKRKRTTRQRGQEANGQSIAGSKRSQTDDAISISVDVVIKRRTRSSVNLKSVNINGSAIAKDVVDTQVSKHSIGKSGSNIISSAKASPCKSSASACTTPVNCVTPINEASPICMGDGYLKQSCRKNLSKLSLMKEINSLITSGQEPASPIKDSRRRREMASVQVLFSRHLDGEIIKHQKKILARLGASVASSMSDATHFIADEFVRTRNMLEAIAFGKPVVTHLWLESCGQANCLIDERNYILRDAKKEKEFGFSLPVSLAHACKHPLLQGQRVFITPNTKPGKEIVAGLVKAVHGLAVERIGRSALKDDKIPDDLLVLSCEEDYEVCVPFLEKGAEVYSSELLLNGIVTQKLDYERHRLFADHVKKTRSTIWLRKDNNHFQPVARCK